MWSNEVEWVTCWSWSNVMSRYSCKENTKSFPKLEKENCYKVMINCLHKKTIRQYTKQIACNNWMHLEINISNIVTYSALSGHIYWANGVLWWDVQGFYFKMLLELIIHLVGHPGNLPFFPFAWCIAVCVLSNAHMYTVYLVILCFAWRYLTSAWPSKYVTLHQKRTVVARQLHLMQNHIGSILLN